ncbi:MAG: protein kinase domain-containing protein [Hyalangium sp.]|uniref:protein kinase domain-containing protein n=1 Tax=Hyalangium sp. TaxID=2028555 RepID=UPI00389B25DD
MTGPVLSQGSCPGCGRDAGGERCIHCGVAVRVGSYRVRQVLGQRGAARTYLADETDGLIVLKELSFSSEPAQATLQAFHQEARQLQNLTHPRIPRYLDMLQLGLGAETRLYLAQEFIEGTPLETELASRHSTELEARELARQVLDLLRYLQSRSPQVFHGDLKPANLIRRPDGALFLVDFGAGWVRGRASPEASHYTPPEQTGGELDATTDLFALGVTLVEALSWTSEEKPRHARPEQLVSRVDVTVEFRQFLARLTAGDAALRFGSADEALRELDAPASPPAPPLRRRLAPVALGTGAALFIFGAGMITGRATAPHPVFLADAEDLPPRAIPVPCSNVEPAPKASTSASDSRRSAYPPPAPAANDTMNTVGAARLGTKEEWAPQHKPLDCDYAKNGIASASGSLETEPQAAFDHDPRTAWWSTQTEGAWLQVDLGRNRLLDALVLDWGWDTRFGESSQSTVMTSVDGSHWSYLHAMTNTPKDNDIPRRVWFPQRVARYVRLNGTGWHGGWADVRSFELYGPDCPLQPKELHPRASDPETIDY